MLDKQIPFELHITTHSLPVVQQENFTRFCSLHDAKPLLIELSRGEFVNQPMLSKIIYADNFETVLHTATQISNELDAESFTINRLKIEVPADKSRMFDNFNSGFDKYFECSKEVM